MKELDQKLARAVQRFWTTLEDQSQRQGAKSGRKDAGRRSGATGGAQLDGFTQLFRELLEESHVNGTHVYTKQAVELPGYFRATKKWDLLVVVDGTLLATVECKSLCGPSFGNNLNNRAEESLGNATDFRTAYREGAFKPALDPWLGYLLLLEDAPGSRKPVRVSEPHFPVFPEFRGMSYVDRSQLLLTRLVRERLYDAACFLTSSREEGMRGVYSEPSEELCFRNLATSLLARAIAHTRTRGA